MCLSKEKQGRKWWGTLKVGNFLWDGSEKGRKSGVEISTASRWLRRRRQQASASCIRTELSSNLPFYTLLLGHHSLLLCQPTIYFYLTSIYFCLAIKCTFSLPSYNYHMPYNVHVLWTLTKYTQLGLAWPHKDGDSISNADCLAQILLSCQRKIKLKILQPC